MNFALDTQLLAYETPRRLLHGIAAEIDAGIIVLPEVKREVGERLKTNEQGRWIEQLLDDRRYSDEQRERIVREAGAAAGEWFADELARTDNRWAAQDETLREAWEARLIARNLPVGVVKRSGLEPEGDRLIVAQAAVYGVRLLTTNNLKTINHKEANAWFAQTVGANHNVVQTPDETLDELSGGSHTRIFQWTLAYAEHWSAERIRRGEHVLRETYEDALERLKGAGFEQSLYAEHWSAERIRRGEHVLRETYEDEPDGGFAQSLREALERKAQTTARAPEERRRATIGKAAQRAGWRAP